MTTSKKNGIELREDLTIFKTTKGIRFEKNIENNNLITEINLNDILKNSETNYNPSNAESLTIDSMNREIKVIYYEYF